MISRKILPLILQAKKREEDKVGDFATSEIQKGASREAYICCNEELKTQCEPFPKCCDCNELKNGKEKFQFHLIWCFQVAKS